MKYTARFTFYYYDEWDTTLCNIYDILVEANSHFEALEAAKEILAGETKTYSSPGSTDFVSLIDENGVIYILSNGQLVVLPKKDYDKLPKSFCSNGETFFVVDRDKIPKKCFPEMRF